MERSSSLETPEARRPATERSSAIVEIALLLAIVAVTAPVLPALTGGGPVRQGLVVMIMEALMIGVIWAGLRRRGSGFTAIGLRLRGRPTRRSAMRAIGWSGVVCVGAALAFTAAGAAMSSVTGRPESADVSSYDFLRGNPLVLVATLMVVWINSSFAEEVIYRGFLITRLEEALGLRAPASPWLAVLVSSLVFGLIHFAWGPAGVVQTAAVGLVFGLAFVKLGRNLWINVLAHAYMDTLLFVAVFFSEG